KVIRATYNFTGVSAGKQYFPAIRGKGAARNTDSTVRIAIAIGIKDNIQHICTAGQYGGASEQDVFASAKDQAGITTARFCNGMIINNIPIKRIEENIVR